MGWIDDVLTATDEAETPQSFVRWACLASIAAVVRDRVYLDKFYYKLFPNLYVMMIASSGLRKGFAANLAQKLVTSVGCTKVMSGRSSIQSIVQQLGTAITRPKQPPLIKAHGFIVSGELSTTFVEDPHSFTILMDLHDGHYHRDGLAWKNTLKHSGIDELKDLSVSMFTMVNQTHLEDLLQKKDVTGGFLARNIIKVEKERHRVNPLTKAPDRLFNVSEFVPYLTKLSEIEGSFKWSTDGVALFERWYRNFKPEEQNDDTGTANRIHDQLLKVAMCLSLARDTKLILELEDITGALDLLDESVKTAKTLTRGTGGKSESAPKLKRFLDILESAQDQRYVRSALLREHWGDFNAMELDLIVNTLTQAKFIAITKKGSKDEEYAITDIGRQIFKTMQERAGD